MSMIQVLQQILIIFCYVIIGFVSGKLGIIDSEQRMFLSKLCSSLLLPFTILSAASMSVGPSDFMNMGIALLVDFLVLGGTIGISLLICNISLKDKKLRTALTGLLTFPNCIFLGLPLCMALFGEIAVLYNSAALIVFNVLFFTVQLPLFTGGKVTLKSILSVPTIATAALLVMLGTGIHWPAPLQTVISSIGSMITPLSLIIIGVMLSENDLAAIFREKQIYPVVLIRNFIIPFLSILLLNFVPLDPASKLCCLVYIACPCATLTTIYFHPNRHKAGIVCKIRSAFHDPVFCQSSCHNRTGTMFPIVPLTLLSGQIGIFSLPANEDINAMDPHNDHNRRKKNEIFFA